MKAIKWIDENLEKTLLVVFLAAIAVIMLITVIARYIFKVGIIWSDETCRYAFIVSVFLGAAYSVKIGAVFRMTSLIDKFGEKARYVIEIITYVCMCAFFLYFAVHCLNTMDFYAKKGTLTTVLKIPCSIFFCVYAICLFIGAIRTAQATVLFIIGKKKK